MNKAEQTSRKSRKPGAGTDKLAYAARLGALEKNLGTAIKRHRDPGVADLANPFKKESDSNKDSTVVVESGF